MRCELSSGSVLGAALSLAVTTMGAGILTLPSAYADAGIFLASFLLLFVAVITVYSVDFIVQSIEKLGLNSYEEITRELLGRKAEEFVRWMLLIYNVGSAIGYLVVIIDLFEPMQPLISSYIPFLASPKHTLVAFWLLFILPLSCVPRLGALHVSSFLAIFATSLISLMIVFRFFVPGPTSPGYQGGSTSGGVLGPFADSANAGGNGKGGSPSGPFAVVMSRLKDSHVHWLLGRHPLLALPIMMFSFDCQSLVFQIYANLNDMRRKTMLIVSVISLLVSGTIHGAVGLFGYLTNPVDVKENVISNYDPNQDPLFAVGYIIYAIPINLAFVLLLFPIRDSIFILWYGFSSASVATHVPRRRDFTRIVDREEELEEQISLLASASRTPQSVALKGRNGTAAALPTSSFALPESWTADGGDGAGGGAAPTWGSTYSRLNATSSQNSSVNSYPEAVAKIAKRRADDTAAEILSNGNGNADAELYEKARSEQAQLLHQKKQHNDIEVISLKDHLIVSITLSTFCTAVALVMPGIVSVVALLGGICSSTLCFTCPALYRWALNRRGLSLFKGHFEWSVMAFMLLFGIVGGVLGTIVAVKASLA